MADRLVTEKSISLHLFVINLSVISASVGSLQSFLQRLTNCRIILPQNDSAKTLCLNPRNSARPAPSAFWLPPSAFSHSPVLLR
jgi:hypothetical protein